MFKRYTLACVIALTSVGNNALAQTETDPAITTWFVNLDAKTGQSADGDIDTVMSQILAEESDPQSGYDLPGATGGLGLVDHTAPGTVHIAGPASRSDALTLNRAAILQAEGGAVTLGLTP